MIFLVAIRDLDFKIAEDIFDESIKQGKWFIKDNSHSIKKRVAKNDKIVIYKSGKTGGYFIGEFIVKTDLFINSDKESFFSQFGLYVEVNENIRYEKKIYLKDMKDKFSFIKNKENYGSAIQRGSISFPEADYKLLKKELLK